MNNFKMEEENITQEVPKKIKDNGKKITAIVIILVLIVSVALIYFKSNPSTNVNEEDAKFIGNNSILYVQTGCSHCKVQEDLFGSNLKYLNVINCIQDVDVCLKANISATPTWVINGKHYEGVKTIQELKDLINAK